MKIVLRLDPDLPARLAIFSSSSCFEGSGHGATRVAAAYPKSSTPAGSDIRVETGHAAPPPDLALGQLLSLHSVSRNSTCSRARWERCFSHSRYRARSWISASEAACDVMSKVDSETRAFFG